MMMDMLNSIKQKANSIFYSAGEEASHHPYSEDSTMKEIDIYVNWQSERPFIELDIVYMERMFRLYRSSDDAAIRVFDATAYDSYAAGKAGLVEETIPTLVICPDDQVSDWMLGSPHKDEICPASRIDSDLPLMIIRLAVRAHERKKYIRQSSNDSLTGLLNRHEMDRHLELELTRASASSPVSILFAGVDNFKKINDKYGHYVGDAILRAIAKVLLSSIQDEHALYRIGGDEFVVIVRMNSTQARALAEFIRQEVQDYDYRDINEELSLTISIGVATNMGDLDSKQFIGQADKALYKAKAEGRNKVVFSGDEESDIDPTEASILDLENRVRVMTDRLTSLLTSRSRELVAQLKREADYDGLTGMFNRRYFDHRMVREFNNARSNNTPLSLIFIDIDHFGKVNKTYGFPTGDRTLQMVAQKINDNIRPVDWTGRYGGEEFCVILPGTREADAVDVAKRIWKAVGADQAQAYDGRTFSVTLSAGVAQLKDSDVTLLDFIQRTSDRTRYAKNNGRNQICSSSNE